MNSTIGSKSPRATDDSPMAKPSGTPTSAPRITPVSTRKTLIPTCSQSGMLRKPCGRELHQPVPGRPDRRPEEGLDPAEGRRRPPEPEEHAHRHQRPDPPGVDRARVPEAHRLLPGEGIVGEPQPDRELPRLPRHPQPSPPMIASSISQIIDRISSRRATNSPEALIARGSPVQRRLREGQPQLPARSAPAAAPSRPAARRDRAPPRPNG